MWLAIHMETLEEPYGTIQIRGWFPSIRNAEDFISENRKNLRTNPIFNYAVCERFRVNFPTKLIERVLKIIGALARSRHPIFSFED